MSDFQHENPYASPEGAAEPAVPEIHGIWRDGDELVVLPRDMRAPKACWVTNETRFVSHHPLLCHSRTGLASLSLAIIPLIGIVLCLILGILLQPLGYIRSGHPSACLCLPLRLRQSTARLIGISLFAAALALSIVSGFSLTYFLIAVPVFIAGLTILVWCDRALIGLHARYGEHGTYRVRGVHPHYLSRLPIYDDSDRTGATIVEPGASPFADPAL